MDLNKGNGCRYIHSSSQVFTVVRFKGFHCRFGVRYYGELRSKESALPLCKSEYYFFSVVLPAPT